MSNLLQIAVLIGSSRPTRIGPHVAKWLASTLESDEELLDARFSIVDVTRFDLPSFNEPVPPRAVENLDQFTHSATRAWNKEIAKYDGYIILSPEYNQGIPGALKNALDFLHHAWFGKPAMIVTYGTFGGSHACHQLRQVLTGGIGVKVIDVAPQLEFPGRDERKHNTSPALSQALIGTVTKDTLGFWKENNAREIIDGARELLRLAKEAR
ncbi:hypothetical protein RBB50_004509 [Rhinocladiella similis]